VKLTSVLYLDRKPVVKKYILKFIDMNSVFEYKLENFTNKDINNLKTFISDIKNEKSSIFFKNNKEIFKYNKDINYLMLENNFSYKFKSCCNIITTFQDIVEHFEKN